MSETVWKYYLFKNIQISFLKLVQKLKYFLWNTETFLCFMKVIWKIIEICKSSSNISKIDLVLKALSPNIQMYKKIKKWTFGSKHIKYSKIWGWKLIHVSGKRGCMHASFISTLTLSLSSVKRLKRHAVSVLSVVLTGYSRGINLQIYTESDNTYLKKIDHAWVLLWCTRLVATFQDRGREGNGSDHRCVVASPPLYHGPAR